MTRRLDRAIAAVAAFGLVLAGYLTWIHYAGIAPFCTGAGGCERVQTSPYAELGGVPVALFGLVGYGAILASLALRGELRPMATALLAYVGVGFSAYLTYLELFRIHAVCQWCVVSALVMVTLAGLASVRVLRGV